MNPSFNLVNSPWIPCIDAEGRAVDLSLRDALRRAREMRELYGESPLVTAALYRLLLAVLHRVFGPADLEAWHSLWNAGHWDAAQLDAYFEQWQHRFDLFDAQNPFYQAPDERVKSKSVASLIHDVASGNNATLFDHHTDDRGPVLTPAQAARMLLTSQCFGLSGLCAPGLPNFTYGPCVKGVIFLVQGNNLFETCILNLLPYPDDNTMTQHPDDLPIWETADPFSSDRTRPRGYLDYLTWPNRRILLIPEVRDGITCVSQATMAPGLVMEDTVDPLKHYFVHEKLGLRALRFSEAKALWRDSAALFELHEPTDSRPPRTFRWLSELIDEEFLDKSLSFRYLAFGLAIGKKAADVNFYRAEHMPLPLAYFEERDLVGELSRMLSMAEDVASRLQKASDTLATGLVISRVGGEQTKKKPKKINDLKNQWAVEGRYWPHLERPFRKVLAALPDDQEAALVAWSDTLRRTAWDAFDQVADGVGHDPIGLKAVVRGREQLAAGLGQVLPT